MRRLLSDERGSAIVFAALALTFLLSVGALAVDAGGLYAAHADAQNAADAAALAGASAFVDGGDEDDARDRAVDFATRNSIRGVEITPEEVDVDVLTDSLQVLVTVRREGLPAWFARALGRGTLSVSATAKGATRAAESAKCVKPFAPSDIWHDQNDDTNHNRRPDPGELWVYANTLGDFYRALGASQPSNRPETGYGSAYRGGDVGMQILLKPAGGVTTLATDYYTWIMPEDPGMEQQCRFTGNGSDHSANALRANLCNCNASKIELGRSYSIDPGARTGPLYQGVRELIDLDPGARWDAVRKVVTGSAYTPWTKSPRVVTVPLFAPNHPGNGGTVKFVAFASVFIESFGHQHDPITARFVKLVSDVRLVD